MSRQRRDCPNTRRVAPCPKPCQPISRKWALNQRDSVSYLGILHKLRDGNSDCGGGVDPQRVRQRRLEKCLQLLERLPAKYLVKAEAPKIIASREQHEAYIQRPLELQRKANRSAEETETAKLLVVLIADYEGKQFTIEKASGVEVLKELMDANGLRQKDLADDLGGESMVSLILKEKRQLNRQQMEKLSHRFHVSPAVFF